MDPIVFGQLNEAYHRGVYSPEETLSEEELIGIEEWVEALIEEGYDLDEYTDDELYEAYLADLDEVKDEDIISVKSPSGQKRVTRFKATNTPQDKRKKADEKRIKDSLKRREAARKMSRQIAGEQRLLTTRKKILKD
jgi:hypothetical protein